MRKRNCLARRTIFGASVIFLSLYGICGASTEQLEELVVTATRQEIEVKQSPQPVRVIKGEDFDRAGKRETLRDLLLFEPGLLPTYHGGTDRRFTLRGVHPDKVLILKDGKRMEGRKA